jgi:hypothetical protein
MSYVQYVKSPRSGRGTFLAVAAYDGLASAFVTSLFASQARIEYRIDLEIFSGNCHIDDSRNRLVRDFLETDCEQLIFLDSDVMWHESDLKKLIDHDRDIVAGIYPLKNDDEDYPVAPLPGERWADEYGLVEVAGVPTGFLKIKRRVFEALYNTVPHHRSKEDGYGRLLIPVLFERTLNGLSRRGGDYEFCRKAREAGFKVYVDPSMQLGHVGPKLWQGCLGHHWRKDIAIPEGLQAIRAGKATAETYLEMYGVWGNAWAMSPEALFTSSLLARKAKGPILDCGSGLSSLVLAASTDQPVHSLEQSPDWAARIERIARECHLDNLHVHREPLIEYGTCGVWYANPPRHDYALALCDGPSGDDKRAGLFDLMRDEISNAPVIVDDIARRGSRVAADEYCKVSGRKLHVFDCSKPFGLIQ